MPSLTIQPDFTFTEDRSYDVLKSDWKEGALFRRAKHLDKVRTYTLIYKNLKKTEKDTIQTLFTDVKGACGDVDWTPPDAGGSIKVRFLENRLTWNKKAYNNYSIKFRLVEILQPTQPT